MNANNQPEEVKPSCRGQI